LFIFIFYIHAQVSIIITHRFYVFFYRVYELKDQGYIVSDTLTSFEIPDKESLDKIDDFSKDTTNPHSFDIDVSDSESGEEYNGKKKKKISKRVFAEVHTEDSSVDAFDENKRKKYLKSIEKKKGKHVLSLS